MTQIKTDNSKGKIYMKCGLAQPSTKLVHLCCGGAFLLSLQGLLMLDLEMQQLVNFLVSTLKEVPQ